MLDSLGSLTWEGCIITLFALVAIALWLDQKGWDDEI